MRDRFMGVSLAILVLAAGMGIGAWAVSISQRLTTLEMGHAQFVKDVNTFANTLQTDVNQLKTKAGVAVTPPQLAPETPTPPAKP